MLKVKNYIKTNRELQQENEKLKRQVKILITCYAEEAVNNELHIHKIRCSCCEVDKKKRIQEKINFYLELFNKPNNL